MCNSVILALTRLVPAMTKPSPPVTSIVSTATNKMPAVNYVVP